MDEDIAVKVTDLHKEFVLPQHKNTSIKQTVVNITRKNGKTTQKVLDGVSFEVKKGDFFGIVGRNGSGKSTLLKILAGVYSPTSGGIAMNGDLTPFIELGVGFNPELSGRDNVFLNGALLGFTHKQMAEMYDEIVEFAELEQFMDQKLKNYSSGMQVRLAFSIAIKAKNEILIFDEVLAVGDEAFQRKCYDIFEQYKANKQTVILVTHDMETVRKFCNKAMLISEGKVVEFGDPRIVASKYTQLNQDTIDKSTSEENKKLTAKYLKVDIIDQNGHAKQSFNFGDRLAVHSTWKGLDTASMESIGVSIFKQSGEHITGINSRTAKHAANWKKQGSITIEFLLNIIPGRYFLLVEIFDNNGKVIDSFRGPHFTLKKRKMEWSGIFELEHAWLED